MTQQEYNRLMRERANVISHNRSVRMSNRGGKPKQVPPKPEHPMVWQASDDDGYIGTFPTNQTKAEVEKNLQVDGFDLSKVRLKQVKAN